MNKLYVIIPLACLIVFYAFYQGFNTQYEARKETVRQEEQAAIKAKQAREQEDRARAYRDAIESAARRKLEREEKDRIESAKKAARMEAEDRRQLTFNERKGARERLDRAKKDLEAVKADVAKLEEEKKHLVDEQAFLVEYVRQATANQATYYALMDKIAGIGAAPAPAAAAAGSTPGN